ncbi:hypothetical protein [Ralstonia pseudosolanacearum]|uniref:hypothetical protein n=1 Tax=Ralstonia pseudosolanacearum TaxID=1310165 RepID=UPI00267517FA|nr:hypothetical protein [Ralstonia pseudosolanacearum]MDO3517738.1 hypothetical protein [Ralstonia pseudosolanacearum]MDO3541023.1 hypothetical protein [Ralstonia pseudosolanacearum]
MYQLKNETGCNFGPQLSPLWHAPATLLFHSQMFGKRKVLNPPLPLRQGCMGKWRRRERAVAPQTCQSNLDNVLHYPQDVELAAKSLLVFFVSPGLEAPVAAFQSRSR